MRRALVVLVAVGLLAPAGAAARPWLTTHRARVASERYAEHLGQTAKATDCARRHRTTVSCTVYGHPLSGDAGGPAVALPDATDETATYDTACVTVHLSAGRLRTHLNPDC